MGVYFVSVTPYIHIVHLDAEQGLQCGVVRMPVQQWYYPSIAIVCTYLQEVQQHVRKRCKRRC
jgi:hypothetical protein